MGIYTEHSNLISNIEQQDKDFFYILKGMIIADEELYELATKVGLDIEELDQFIDSINNLLDEVGQNMDEDGQYLNDFPEDVENLFYELNEKIDN